MKDFIFMATLWIVIGFCLTIFIARSTKIISRKKQKNYESEGIAIGMCRGVAVGTRFEGGLK